MFLKRLFSQERLLKPECYTIEVANLLEADQYRQAVNMLAHAAEESPNSLLSNLLIAARQICQLLEQNQSEIEWHRQAAERASTQEIEARALLANILRLAGELTESRALVAPVPNTSVFHNGLGNKPAELLPVRVTTNGWKGQDDATAERSDGSQRLLVYCLGAFQVYLDGQAIDNWPNRKGKSIFKYLVANRSLPVAKEVLMQLFWPDAEPEAARNNLNVSIYGLRQTLRHLNTVASCILFQDDCYLLNPDLSTWVDFEAFADHCLRGQQYESADNWAQAVREYSAAEAIYQGQLFEEDRYEEWLMCRRQHLQDSYLTVLDHLSRYFLDTRNFTTCVTLCHKMLVVDACLETAHRRLMQCYAQQGQPYLALRQYHSCEEAQRKELETLPSPDIVKLYERIRDGHKPQST